MEQKQKQQHLNCCHCGAPVTKDKLAFVLHNGTCICTDCLTELYTANIGAIQRRQKALDMEKAKGRRLHPSDIAHYLDQYIIGQDKAKQVLANAVYNHYKMIEMKHNKKTNVDLEKSNILLCGPTGSGKTALLKALSKFLQVPFAISDATSLTSAG